MKMDYLYAKGTEYRFSNMYQNIEVVLYTVIGFFLPFLVGHPQIVVGVLVNALLASSALTIRLNKILPLMIAPTFGVVARGMLFGPFTIFIVYMMPFIWFGNAIYVFMIKYMKVNKKINYFLSMPVASLLKAAFLFLCAYLLFMLGLVPEVFLTAMGVLQLTTALIGGVVAYGVYRTKLALQKN